MRLWRGTEGFSSSFVFVCRDDVVVVSAGDSLVSGMCFMAQFIAGGVGWLCVCVVTDHCSVVRLGTTNAHPRLG